MNNEILHDGRCDVRQSLAVNFLEIISIGIILCGLGIRLMVYVSNPPLYVDETFLANNVLGLTYRELCGSLGWGQAAPLGFLMLAKTCVRLFGESEFALRSWPLIASCLGVCLFYRLSKEYLQGVEAIGAMLLLALSKTHIYFAVDFKQYSTDVLVVIYVLLLALHFKKDKIGWRFYAMSGALSLWFSFPVIFILAGIGISDLVSQLVMKNKTRLKQIIAVGFFWCASFAVYYIVSLQGISQQKSMIAYWGPFYLQSPAFNMVTVNGLREKMADIFDYNFGAGISGFVAAICCCAGCVKLFFEKKYEGWYLIGSIIISIAAFLLKQYPLFQRLSLFLVPLLIILIAKGISGIRIPNKYITRLIQVSVLALLLYAPLATIAQGQIKRSMYIPALTYVQDNAKPYDVLVGIGVIDYYFMRMPFRNVMFTYIAAKDVRAVLEKIERNKDVWIVTRPSELDEIESAIQSNERAMEIKRFSDFFVYRCSSLAKEKQ